MEPLKRHIEVLKGIAEGVKRGTGLPKALTEHVFDRSARLFAIRVLFFGSFRDQIDWGIVVFAGSDPLKTLPEILFGRWGQVKGRNGDIFGGIEKVF